MRIVRQVSGLLTGLFTRLSTLVKEQLLPNVNRLRVSITQAFQSVVSLLFRLVQTTLSIKAWRVSLITVAQSIKAVLTTAKLALIQTGSQLLTIAHRMLQLVLRVLLQSKDKLVASIKLVLLRSKKASSVQTHTAPQSIQAGVKSQGRANQLRQRAIRRRKKGS